MRYQVTTELDPPAALDRANTYFGPSGLGLVVRQQTPVGLMLQGGGGHVVVTVLPGDRTTLELETREWDYAVRQFMAEVSRRRPWWQRLRRRKPRPQTQTPGFTILNNTHPPDR